MTASLVTHPPHHGAAGQRKPHQHEGRGDLGTADQDARRGLHLVPLIGLVRPVPAAFAEMHSQVQLIDVRTPEEFSGPLGHIRGARLLAGIDRLPV